MTGVVIFPQVPSAVSYGRSENVVAESCALVDPSPVPDDRVGLRGAGVPRSDVGRPPPAGVRRATAHGVERPWVTVGNRGGR